MMAIHKIPTEDITIIMPVTRTQIVASARSWLGTPYHHQGALQGIGCDCLGLIRGVYKSLHGCEPESMQPYSPDWAEAGGQEQFAAAARRHLIERDDLTFDAGDILLFRWRTHLPAKHAGIATGENQMVHAQSGADVCEIFLQPWWLRRLAYVFKFPGLKN